MAAEVDEEWYLAGSGVPVGWKARAVAFRPVPLLAGGVSGCIAPGAMVDEISVVVLCGALLVAVRSLLRAAEMQIS
jgi:hypothetical protein